MSTSFTIETQTPLSAPSSARLHVSRTLAPPITTSINHAGNFITYNLSSSRTHESRHEQSLIDNQPPPAYIAGDANLPPYARKAPELPTLARYLFKFGFFFPPFWIMGALILLSPLRAPSTPNTEAAWLPEKTDEERERIIAQLRKVEVKWAMKCVWALTILVLLGTVTGVAAWATFHT